MRSQARRGWSLKAVKERSQLISFGNFARSVHASLWSPFVKIFHLALNQGFHPRSATRPASPFCTLVGKMTRKFAGANSPAAPSQPGVHPQTGPRTLEGKAASSENALKHGCRSAKTLLRDEDPAEFEFLVAGWFDHYQPETPFEESLVEQVARAHWFLKRAAKRLEEVEWELPSVATHWTESQQKLFAAFSRYKTAAERAFFRFFREAETQCDKQGKARDSAERARLRAAAIEIKWASQKEAVVFDELKQLQLIEVETVDGQCKTTFYPTNEQLEKRIAANPRGTYFVKRIFNFENGVPPEYAWACPDHVKQTVDTKGVQKMRYSQWLRVIEQERAAGTGHACPVGSLFGEDDEEADAP